MAVYSVYGPPPFVSLAAMAGFRPPAARGAGAALHDGEDLIDFLAAFPGGERAP
jgi:hypothetical protein